MAKVLKSLGVGGMRLAIRSTSTALWGFGYGPSYQVYLDNMTGVWVCYAMRYSSCD